MFHFPSSAFSFSASHMASPIHTTEQSETTVVSTLNQTNTVPEQISEVGCLGEELADQDQEESPFVQALTGGGTTHVQVFEPFLGLFAGVLGVIVLLEDDVFCVLLKILQTGLKVLLQN